MSFKKIAVTTDLSENANAALPAAAELARRFNAEVELIHVFEDATYYATVAAAEGIMTDNGEWIQAVIKDRKRELDAAADAFARREGLTVKPVFLQGHSVNEIVRHAQETNVDCLVVATHGRTGLPHLLLGSIAERLVRLSPCPVLTVRPTKIAVPKAKPATTPAIA